ncbi:TPA: glycosyltransferase [Escherichia coli]|uniref:glycosyltransferase n=1 Tax=Escherichia coli TaxID=562 RepID=UPI001FF33B4D|nr:glycosyltransferase [Escherichia coli]MCU6839497.1 glycosyltransferase [Escherichia coli]MDD8486956.1 glycosyltransferase [Escherichia coli]HCB2714471.1 glycosyltransferase family 4 protein [Escherichia coli]HCB2769095.1 glycosyltransferase family 4 protein [Escherichia coli]HDP8250930.1 glycosyltransferase family 4 protein [Escherichia coli]
MSIIVNHVMSSDTVSGIFTDLLSYYKRYCDKDISIVESCKAIDSADIYHYHRPHLEIKLKENSVVTIHHDLYDTDPWLDYDKFHHRYMEAKKILCLNSSQQRYVNDKGLMNTEIIPHGYNSDIFNGVDSPKKIKNKVCIGFISKRYGRKVKGEAYLYEIFKRLDSQKYRFIFVGGDRTITAYKASQFGFEVKCYERLPYYCYGDLYKQLNFLLVTSCYEGGPANIPEAIASGTPIISTPVGMVNDYVRDGINGIILTGDIDKDIETINYFSQKNKYQKLASNSIETTKNIMSWKDVMKKTSLIYKSLVGGI